MYNIIINMWWMAQIDRMDYVYVLMEGQHQHVVDVQDGQDGQRVLAGQGGGQEHGVLMDRGVVRSSRRGRGAGPAKGRRSRGVEIIQPAVNPTGRPKKDNTNKKKENKIKKFGVMESVVEENGEGGSAGDDGQDSNRDATSDKKVNASVIQE